MKWLALETATECCSVAVAVGDAVFSRSALA
ncbi:tRNA (adenosine(37)-N6)-threonylcarbamoyltransferase complex dimerization subunit type 1 TsaB, partial [Acidithiobacillus caldus]|nr:tRNA (adenosine(37)-N6)-threonylcarbamoyltransferase complex dimerization subunit type 1 TsaB [Acidithiobacillus caldus]